MEIRRHPDEPRLSRFYGVYYIFNTYGHIEIKRSLLTPSLKKPTGYRYAAVVANAVYRKR
jgi:hypothetical protein